MSLGEPCNIRCYRTGWSVSVVTPIVRQLTAPLVLCSGFDYHFNAIQNEDNELFNAYKNMFEASISQGQGLRKAIITYFPIYERFFVRIVFGPVIRR